MTDEVPEIERESARESFFERASIVWLVPLGALVIALAVAWNSWQERGPLISVTFENASGVVANETELRFRDVAVGVVERISFPAELDGVTTHIRLDADIADFVDEDAAFWIVRPEVTTQGISGLDTVLSGVYIEGSWDSEAGQWSSDFEGLDRAPLRTAAQDGLLIELRSSRDSGMTENTPILYKGIEVGRIGPARISADGRWVFAEAVVYEPQDELITSATRFWNASGFSFSLGANGAELDFNSLASLISGGLTFDTLVSGGQPVEDGVVFEVYPDEATARNSVFLEGDGEVVTLSLLFEENVSGLTAEAPVEWRGVKIGEVANVTGIVDEERFGDGRVRLVATIEIRPARFGFSGETPRSEVLDYLAERVDEGLRARLATASLLTGGLKVEFVVDEAAEAATFDPSVTPFPFLPTTASDVDDVAASAEGLVKRLTDLPIESLLDSAINFLDNATAVVASEDLRQAPTELRGLLADARAVVGSEEVQRLPEDLGEVASDIRSVTEQLRVLLDDIEAEDGVARVLAAIDQAGAAAEQIGTAAEGVPDLLEELTALSEQIAALPLDRLVTDAADLATAAEAVMADPATQALPADLQAALAQVTDLLQQIDTEGTVLNLNETLAAATAAADGVATSVEGLPELLEQIEGLAARISGLPLDRAVTEVSDLAAAGRSFLEQPETKALPGETAEALQSLTALLDDIAENDTVARLTEAVTAARDAAQGIDDAADGVPELIDRLQSLAARVEGLPLDRLSDELADTLAEAQVLIADAAEADLPDALSGALNEIDLALSELREGGLIDSANATLASARRAADAVAQAADDLPAAVQRLSRLLDTASVTLATYSDESRFNRQTLQTLREVEQAAAAVESLSRALERRPNSIILGR